MSDSVVVVAREEWLARVTLNRPSKLNALNAQLIAELTDVFGTLRGDATVRAAILTGAGKAFVAGADISEMSELPPERAYQFSTAGHRLAELLEALPFPIIAAVNGFALGGGLELALCCDFIYAADNARFGFPEVSLGLIPGFGGTQRLARRIGPAHARELILTGELIDAETALRLGIANRVFGSADLIAAAERTARTIANRGPLAVAAAKRVINSGFDADQRTGCELEARAFAGLFGSEDQREGARAFLEKRAGDFKGR